MSHVVAAALRNPSTKHSSAQTGHPSEITNLGKQHNLITPIHIRLVQRSIEIGKIHPSILLVQRQTDGFMQLPDQNLAIGNRSIRSQLNPRNGVSKRRISSISEVQDILSVIEIQI